MLQYVRMLALAFISWWYGRGWKQILEQQRKRSIRIAEAFSIMQLLQSLFAPWRRIISYPGASLGDKLRAVGDNLVSRAVGFVIRLFAIVVAVLLLVMAGLFSFIELIIWPLLPPAVVVATVLGVLK